jgi:hypothetical protein
MIIACFDKPVRPLQSFPHIHHRDISSSDLSVPILSTIPFKRNMYHQIFP